MYQACISIQQAWRTSPIPPVCVTRTHGLEARARVLRAAYRTRSSRAGEPARTMLAANDRRGTVAVQRY